MEDASKEFQVFLSPSAKTNEKKQTNKHRLVPVINKLMTSSSSSFALNQRRCSVYKAVSGVSFQETDVEQRKSTKKDKKDTSKRESRRDRKESYASDKQESEKGSYTSGKVNHSGSTRSRSVASVESKQTDSNQSKPEITHPFSPVVLYNQGRQSRYTKSKDRRRSHSHVRYGAIEMTLADNSNRHKDDQPTRPRRSRSASRCRKSVLTAFPTEESLKRNKHSTDKQNSNKAEPEKRLSIKCEDQSQGMMESFLSSLHREECPTPPAKEIDFSVSDNYWRQCEEIVTRQLDSLTKEDGEEPEGGYFSLEREENEEIERPSDSLGGCFQRDHDNEAIYVEHLFVKDAEKNKLERSKLCDFSKSMNIINVNNEYSTTEVGFVDDEGLYEEIIFHDQDAKNCNNLVNHPVEAHNDIIASMHSDISSQLDKSCPTPLCFSTPKVEQRKLSTVIYITCDDRATVSDELISVSIDAKTDHIDNEKYSSSVTVNQNSDVYHHDDAISRLEHLYEGHTQSANANYESSVEAGKSTSAKGWCSCGSGQENPSSSFNHSASCIQSKSSCLNTKYSLINGNDLGSLEDTFNKHRLSVSNGGATLGNGSEDSGYDTHAVTVTPIRGETLQPQQGELPYLVEFPEYELSDIDLDMFAPRDKPERKRRKKTGSSSKTHSAPIEKENSLEQRLSSLSVPHFTPRRVKMTSPKTFQAVLHDSIFNPPDTESIIGDTDALVITEDQIITCITDSSSDDESDDDDDISPATSPWLEAKSEFEFVAFKSDDKPQEDVSKRKKGRKIISLPNIPKIFSSSLAQSSSSSPSSHSHKSTSSKNTTELCPERPARRRRRSKASKRQQQQKTKS